MASARSASGVDGLSEVFGSVTGEAVESQPLTRRQLRNGAVAPAVASVASVAEVLEAPAPDALAWLQTPPVAEVLEAQSAAPLSRRAARLAEQAAAATVAEVAPVAEVLEAAATPTLSIPIVTTEQTAESRLRPTPQITHPQAPTPEVFSYQPSYAAEVAPVPAKSRRAAAPASRKPAPRKAAPRKTAPRTTARKKLSSFATILAVSGFFASVCIPAYALLPTDDSDAVAADVASDDVADASLFVAADAGGLEVERDSFSATTKAELADARSNALKIANFEAYEKSGARELGDDYPWFSELSNNQGGGLSPLNYYYRECVDFVAWKLNVDAGSTKAPFKYDWHNLTPSGGNAYQWKYNWEANGWATGSTPKVGAVAWFGYHVSYVKSVNADGTVTIEEYNYSSDHLYGQRTIPASEVTLYLYAPPR